jgi:hypothetical protein
MSINPNVWYCRDNATISPVVFTGSQSTTTLTVTGTPTGTLAVGTAYGSSTAVQGIITALGTGTGGAGTYTVSSSQTIASTTFWGFSATATGSVGWSSVAPWTASTAYTVGQLRRQKAVGAFFTASQSTTSLSVSAITSGSLGSGQTVYIAGTTVETINAFGTGTGGTGTYTVSASQTITSQAGIAILTPGNERVFVCTVAGTSGSTEPVWTLTKGAKTTDNTVTWMEVTGQPGVNGDITNTPSWVAIGTAALGNIIKDAAGTHLFVCTTAGTTKSAPEPVWNTTTGGTTTDNFATWTCLGDVSSAWAAPAPRLSNMLNTSWAQAGNYIYAAADHAEVQPSAINITTISGTPASPNYVISVAAATVPPTSASWSAGASVTTVGPNGLTLNVGQGGGYYLNGLTLSAGSGATTAGLFLSAGRVVIDGCSINKLGTTGAASAITIGSSGTGADALINNTQFKFGNTQDRITYNGRLRLQNIPTLLTSGSSVPTNSLFTASGPYFLEIVGVDLSPIGTTPVLAPASGTIAALVGCKLASGAVIISSPVTATQVDAINCDSAATDYQKARYAYAGTLTTETAVVRTSGAVVDATHVSDKIATNTNTSWISPFASIALAIWNATTGSSVTVTVYGVYNGAALPNNDEIWMEVEYPGSASSPLASIATTTKANAMTAAAAVTSDTSAWDSVATARANSTAYALGDARSVSSNTGRIFFCTTAGTSSGSLPAGYASAADGGSVTDGTAVFRAGERFKLTSTFTPQLAGPIYVRPKGGRVSSTYYIDPLPALS